MGITTDSLEIPAQCQPCETMVCTAQSVLFMAWLKYLADEVSANGGTLQKGQTLQQAPPHCCTRQSDREEVVQMAGEALVRQWNIV